MAKAALLLGLAVLASGVMAGAPNWMAQIGLDNNTCPGVGDDPFNYFGAVEGAVDDYPDAWDVVEPTGR